MVSPSISDISLFLGVLDAVSTVNFCPLEPHPLTVSSARLFEVPEESETDGGIAEVTEDEIWPPTDRQPRVVIRDSSIKLWDLSTSSGLWLPVRIHNKATPLIICLLLYAMHRSSKPFLRNSHSNSPPIFTPETVAVTQSLFLSGVFKLAVAKNREERRHRRRRSGWLKHRPV